MKATDKPFMVLAAPGLLASLWTAAIAVTGVTGYAIGEVAPIIWAATLVVILCLLVIVFWRDVALVALYGAPCAASSVVMFPWLYRGPATFPGTWFWDGWAYLAFGQSFLKYPLDTPLPAVISPMYELGIGLFKTRFITAGLLALFSASPVSSGETQAAAGYLILFYVFTFACSTAALGSVLFPTRPSLRTGYVVFATVSGYVLTTLHANNFDQLLSMALLPLSVALALSLRWGELKRPVALGVVCAAIATVYPELAPPSIGMPALVILWRIWSERPHPKPALTSLAAGSAILLLAASPAIYGLWTFFINQFLTGAAAYDPNVARPGEGYFLSFYSAQCAPGALWSLFPPFTPCRGFSAYLAGTAGAVFCVAAALGALRWPRASVLLCAFLPLAAGLVMLIVKKYDYGAYKLFAIGFPFWAALIVFFVSAVQAKWGKAAVLTAVVVYLGVVGFRIAKIDDAAKYKTVEVFKEPVENIPTSATVALQIADHLAFQWAAYYLRDNSIITVEGSLTYLRTPRSARPDGKAMYLITDRAALSCWANPISTSEAYSVFKAPAEGGLRALIHTSCHQSEPSCPSLSSC